MKPTIEKILRDAIENSGEPLLQISRRARVSRGVLYRFANEYDKTGLTLRTAQRLLDYFGFTVVKVDSGK